MLVSCNFDFTFDQSSAHLLMFSWNDWILCVEHIFFKTEWWQNVGKTMSISKLWIKQCKLAPTKTVLCTRNFACANVCTKPFYVHKNQCMQILNLLSSVGYMYCIFYLWVFIRYFFREKILTFLSLAFASRVNDPWLVIISKLLNNNWKFTLFLFTIRNACWQCWTKY